MGEFKYCDDKNCLKYDEGECKLGFRLQFHVPRGYDDIQRRNWGHVIPKVCRQSLKQGE